MIVNIGTFVGGLVLLLVGGRLLVSASVDTASRLRVSALVVGLTLVAWGTSAPELSLNLISASKGRGDLALGNVVGANICNIALVLGACAIIRPLVVQQRLVNIELWINAALLVFMAGMALLFGLPTWSAAVMLAAFAAYSAWTIMSALRQTEVAPASAAAIGRDPTMEKSPMGWFMIGACFVGGLALLTFGGSLASDGASGVAIGLGVPAAIVGVTIVSIGTTLPEMVTGLMAVRRGQTDLAVGNVVGSCLFNAGAIFGLSGLIGSSMGAAETPVDASLRLPLVYMALLALALIAIVRTHDRTVSRTKGTALLASYVVFLATSSALLWQSGP